MSIRQRRLIGALFPSPLEVNRFISDIKIKHKERGNDMFPSPLEVSRFISTTTIFYKEKTMTKFPSPLEVYRFISLNLGQVLLALGKSFRPLSRYIGLYQN